MTMRPLRLVRPHVVNDYTLTPPQSEWPRLDIRLALTGMALAAVAGFALALIVVAS